MCAFQIDAAELRKGNKISPRENFVKKNELRKIDADKGIYSIPIYINDAFGITFGRSLKSEIKKFEKWSSPRSYTGLIQAGDFPEYCIEPKNAFTIMKDGKPEVIGNYYVEVIGNERIAFAVKVEDIEKEYHEDILAILQKKYGNFEFTTQQNEKKIVQLVSQKNPQRSIGITVTSHEMTITYHCKDIEEKYKESPKVFIGH